MNSGFIQRKLLKQIASSISRIVGLHMLGFDASPQILRVSHMSRTQMLITAAFST